MASRVQATPKATPEYDVEYEDYSARYASPPKKGQAVLGYRSISPNKMPYQPYDTVDSGGSDSHIYGVQQRNSSGRPEVRDGAEAGDAIRSRLNFSSCDSGERREPLSDYPDRDADASTPFSRFGKNYATGNGPKFATSPTPAQYDPTQYQETKVCMPMLFVVALLQGALKILMYRWRAVSLCFLRTLGNVCWHILSVV